MSNTAAFAGRLQPATDLTSRLLYLRGIPVLASVAPSDLVALAGSLAERTFAAGETVAREEDPPNGVHLVTSGRVKLSRKGRAIGAVEAPASIGLHPLVARSPDGVGAVAETDASTLEVDAETLAELVEDHPQILTALLESVAKYNLAQRKKAPSDIFYKAGAVPLATVPVRPLDVVELIFFLRRMPAFRSASVNALSTLAQQVNEVRLPAGHTLWRIGDPIATNLLIVSGVVRATSPEGTFRGGPGAPIGGLDTLARSEERWYDLVTETPLIALEVGPEDLFDIFEDHHDMGMEFLAMLSGDLLSTWDKRIEAGEEVPELARDLPVFGPG
jgi:CRP-like cAMP-binding protein